MVKVSKEHVDARRQQILTAALICFANEGYQKTTMQDVARQAGLSAGSLYNYFESKEAIIEALAEHSVRKIDQLIAGLGERSAISEVLESFAGRFAETLGTPEGREVARFNVALWAEALSSPQLERRLVGADCKVQERIAELVKTAWERGERSRDVDPKGAAEAVLIYVSGMVVRTALDPAFDAVAHWRLAGARLMRGELWG